MAKFMKISLGLFLVAIAAAMLLVNGLSQAQPPGQAGPKAEALAARMQAAVNLKAWQDTGAVQWVFRGQNRHLWDKKRHLAQVEWQNYRVLVDLNQGRGLAYLNGVPMEGKAGQDMVAKAHAYWINDSFWLNPIAKFYDPGVSREYIAPEYDEGMMVRYSSGGLTPGDSYLWRADANGLPRSWQMWVSIIPVGGLRTTWEGWIELETGAKVATLHKFDYFDLELKLSQIKGAADLSALIPGEDPFKALILAYAQDERE